MRRFSLAWILIAAGLLWACDRDGRIDAGSDAGVDSGPSPDDAGTDAPPDDAPPMIDAGPPTPLEAATEDARTDYVAFVAAVDGTDAALLDVGELVQIEAAETRLDAIIGEKIGSPIDGIIGEKTMLALRPTYGQILVVDRHLLFASIELGRVLGSLGTDTMLDPLRNALTAQLTSIAALRAQLQARRDEIAMLDASLPGTEDVSYVDARPLHFVRDRTTVFGLLEGSATDSDGSVTVSCAGTTMLSVSVMDQDGASLVGGTTGGPHNFTLRTTGPTVLRIDAANGGLYDECTVQIQGRRHFRGAPVMLSAMEVADLRSRSSSWTTEMRNLLADVFMMETDGGPDGAILSPILEEYALELSAETARWRGIGAAIPLEDLDQLELELQIEIALSTRLEGSSHLAGVFPGPMIATRLAALRAMNEATLAAVTSP